jgi:hypothetical protein
MNKASLNIFNICNSLSFSKIKSGGISDATQPRSEWRKWRQIGVA